jgi:ribonuclease G
MPYSLLVNTTAEERRVALLEGERLREFYAERRFDRGLIGNIYKGRVVRVMPGMEAAFVEIGIGRPAFLQATDAVVPGDAIPEGLPVDDDAGQAARVTVLSGVRPPVSVGRDLLVQVTRDAFAGKGPRLTTQISLAGRCLVYLPETPVFGVSRRIEDPAERARLRELAGSLAPPGAGAIMRTAAAGRPESELAGDVAFLSELWQRATSLAAEREAPELVHEDLDLLLRTARDLLTEGCDRVVVDTETDYDRLLQFVDSFTPELDHKVEWYRGEEPLFSASGVEASVSALLDRVVWLPGGGSIVIDRTEALTAIDVNTGTGGQGGGREPTDDLVLRTNLDAARAVAEQLRVRNVGGIVVIDFVDMRDPDHRRQVQEALAEAIRPDRAHVDLLPMSRLGLVELTRSRARDTAFSRRTDPCPYCDGRGWVRSIEQLCGDIVRKVSREVAHPQSRGVRVLAHPRVMDALVETYKTSLADLETRHRKPIRLVRRDDFHLEGYAIRRD